MFLSVLIAVTSSTFAASATPTFVSVAVGRASGLDAESWSVRRRATDDARAFERHRQRGDRDFADTCATRPESNLLCGVVGIAPAPETTPGPSVEVRRALFDALTKLDDPAQRATACPAVADALAAVLADEAADVLHSRARYWAWRCATLGQDGAAAARWRDELWTHHPLSDLTFRALRADHDARLDEALSDADVDWPVITRDPRDETLNDWLRGAEALIALGHDGAAALVLKRIDQRATDVEDGLTLYIGALSARIARSIPSARPVNLTLEPLLESDRAFMRRPLLEAIFARPGYFADLAAARGAIEAPLLAGLIHQESALYPRARSNVAYGLAQMKPAVATELNQQVGLFPDRATIGPDDLFDPRVSLPLAATFLAQLISRFDGDARLGLAAYHSGPERLRRWLESTYKFKDPEVRAHALYLDLEGQTSTAAYVLAVYGRAAWYRALYGEDLGAP